LPVSDVLHTFVYGLHDGDFAFWYVGMTKDPEHRINGHRLRNPRFTPDTQMHVLEEVHGTLEEVRPVEQEWIDGLRAVGYPLVNSERENPYTGPRPVTDAHRANLSVALRGKPHSPDHTAKVASARRGKPLTAEHKAKLRGRIPWNKGVPMSEEQKAAKRAAWAPGGARRLAYERRKALAT
jgi:hypothetical protein